jgi:outer membrane lipoprotein SlyB
MPQPIRRSIALLTSAALLLGACTTRDARIGADDGSDACRQQVVQLDSTGNFFAEDIIRGAAMGAVGGALLGGLIAAAGGGRGRDVATGAAIGGVAGGVTGGVGGYLYARQQQSRDQAGLNSAIASDLARENAELDRTQVAFDLLMDCRFATANRTREEVRSGRISRAQGEAIMADIRGRTQRDIAFARTINERITRRGAEFDTALDKVAPEAKQMARVSRPEPITASPRSDVALRLRPDPASPEVAKIPANARVRVTPANGSYALVESDTGLRGYAPAENFPMRGLASRAPVATAGTGSPGDMRQLAATNIARRDNFTESVSNAERLAQGQGFELAT